MRHALITNDFPPKVGGIQQYLYEIYRRLDPATYLVITTSHADAPSFDRAFPGKLVRLGTRLLPTPDTRRELRALLDTHRIDGIVYDPLLPIGWLRGAFGRPFAAIAHGAEVRVPRLLPGARHALARVVTEASGVVCAGSHPMREIAALGTGTPLANIPPGIDGTRYRPASPADRARLRHRFLVDPEAPLLLFASRLVPRKGADTLLLALSTLRRPVELHVIGEGRDRGRLLALLEPGPHRVVWHGAASEDVKIALYQAADLFVFPVRDRWAGLEQEGFGIVLLEAQACGTPVVAGLSGGTFEAVEPRGGSLLSHPDPDVLGGELERWLACPRQLESARSAAAAFARRFDYDRLSMEYAQAVEDFLGG